MSDETDPHYRTHLLQILNMVSHIHHESYLAPDEAAAYVAILLQDAARVCDVAMECEVHISTMVDYIRNASQNQVM